jgi:hypothetical protein
MNKAIEVLKSQITTSENMKQYYDDAIRSAEMNITTEYQVKSFKANWNENNDLKDSCEKAIEELSKQS